jgi:hypothetical protein
MMAQKKKTMLMRCNTPGIRTVEKSNFGTIASSIPNKKMIAVLRTIFSKVFFVRPSTFLGW